MNMNTREHILQESKKLLMRIGPSSMTMDMVARSCGISKRTLYETFPDKRSLIVQCIEDDHRVQDASMKQIFAEADNCFDALFRTYTHVREYFNSTSMAFVADIKRLYPEIFEQHRRQEDEMIDGLSRVLAQAQTEGFVIADINTRIAAFLFLSTMRNLHEDGRIRELGFNQIEVFDGAFLNFLRGIATIRGIQFIETQLHSGT